jgi:hypothetical protein
MIWRELLLVSSGSYEAVSVHACVAQHHEVTSALGLPLFRRI